MTPQLTRSFVERHTAFAAMSRHSALLCAIVVAALARASMAGFADWNPDGKLVGIASAAAAVPAADSFVWSPARCPSAQTFVIAPQKRTSAQ